MLLQEIVFIKQLKNFNNLIDGSKLNQFFIEPKYKCLVTGNELVIGNSYLARIREIAYLGILRFWEWIIYGEISKSINHKSAISFLLWPLSNTFVPQINIE